MCTVHMVPLCLHAASDGRKRTDRLPFSPLPTCSSCLTTYFPSYLTYPHILSPPQLIPVLLLGCVFGCWHTPMQMQNASRQDELDYHRQTGAIIYYFKCARRVCVCTSVRVYESEIHGVWRSVHGRRAWSEAWSNQPYAQDPGMSLCESTCGPHVLVCVRARGAFKKKNTEDERQYSIMLQQKEILPGSSIVR